MDLRRLVCLLSLVVVAMLASVTPASAHAELRSSNPAEGAALSASPSQVQLTFSEAVSPKTIEVTGAQGTNWTIGQIAVEGPVVTVPVQAAGPAGPYAIVWTVTSEDGDDVSGVVNFTMTVPATPAPTTTATTPAEPATTTVAAVPSPAPQASAPADDGGVPPWVWVLIGIAVLLVVGLLLALRARRAPTGASPTGSDDSGDKTGT
jgi:methionine-rich copper-binding protein CopC